ncbi:MAG: hypothetical protein WAU88_00215 [Candidatus Zixiibacteriota bacterium]
MEYQINSDVLRYVEEIVSWYGTASQNRHSRVLPHPAFGRWKSWDDCRLWCALFFTVAAKGGSGVSRDYLEGIEDGYYEFELHPKGLIPLSYDNRMRQIWEFGRGKNRLNKALGRFFSTPQKFGRPNSYERVCTDFFCTFEKHGFTKWLYEIDQLSDERSKAKCLEEVPGISLKASRDFLNELGMTTSLIALDVQVLGEMREHWRWDVPTQTPSGNRGVYEAIEDAVRLIAKQLQLDVLQIDKAIYFARMTGEYRTRR